jgi:putative redox protein
MLAKVTPAAPALSGEVVMSSQHPRPPIVVTHEGGVKFAAQVRSHRILVDQSARGGGEDAGPEPIELLGAALGTCVALYVERFCHARAIPHDGMRVEVEQHGVANPNRVGRFVVRVVLPAGIPERYAGMLERTARSCPAHNTLVRGAEVEVHIEATATAGV